MKNNSLKYLPLALAITSVLVSTFSCGIQPRKAVKRLNEVKPTAQLELAQERSIRPFDTTALAHHKTQDTIHVNFEGKDHVLMKAIRGEDGEMTAFEELDAAVITARFRNIAERHGKVDLQFNIIVPESMRDENWQVRFYPDLFILGDSIRLEPVLITGDAYRRNQVRGYERYDRFVNSIIQDSTKMIDLRSLNIFIERNIPALYAFKNDTTFVSEEQFQSVFGVTEKEAIEHYTNKLTRWNNNRRKANKSKMYSKYVKNPIVTSGIRLDTVLTTTNGDFVYMYTQTINTRPKLKKAEIVLSGEIRDVEKKIYDIPASSPLTFYISSITSFVDPTERYLTKIIERRASANTACYIDFEVGKDIVREQYSNNASELRRIKSIVHNLINDADYDIDSIVVRASASPEGSVASNRRLSRKRSASIAAYMDDFMNAYQDSLDAEYGIHIDIENDTILTTRKRVEIPFKAKAIPENWEMLDNLVINDEVLSTEQKDDYFVVCTKMRDLDAREEALRRKPYYKHLRKNLYPECRNVRFDFFLHRKGMVKDTVHTTELDTLYMKAIQLLQDSEYEQALSILRPYEDYNTAIALIALDYNHSALEILKLCEHTAQVNYMLAILSSRFGNDQEAVDYYLKSVEQEPSYKFRGNLDPEISLLIKEYNLDLDALTGGNDDMIF